MKIPKELIKEFVRGENFKNTNDILASIKSMFGDVLEEVLQCEIDEKLGYDKHERRENLRNYIKFAFFIVEGNDVVTQFAIPCLVPCLVLSHILVRYN